MCAVWYKRRGALDAGAKQLIHVATVAKKRIGELAGGFATETATADVGAKQLIHVATVAKHRIEELAADHTSWTDLRTQRLSKRNSIKLGLRS